MTNRNIVVIDTETTGPNPFVHELLSLALVPLDRRIPPLEVHVLTPPDAIWSEFARSNFEKFRIEWQAKAISSQVAAELVQKYLFALTRESPVILAGHNVGFDRAFFQKLAYVGGIGEFAGVSHRNLDTHTLIFDRVFSGEAPDYAETSSGAFSFYQIGISDNERHTALGDALATRELIEKLMKLPDIATSSLGR